MDSFTNGSKSPLQNDNRRFPHANHRQKNLEPLDRPAKRRRSVSPLSDKLSRCKRTTLIQHHLQTTLTKARKDENLLNQFSKSAPVMNAAVDSMNERTTRLGLENAYPEDVEMDFRPHSDGEEAEDKETSYERVPMHQSTHTLTSSLLPLHKPHPIAYQQHLALISSSRSKKLSNSNRHLNSQKKSVDNEDEPQRIKENNF
ncbi:hypothetical protein PtA15_7A48 [Puccinia triticina]|uniref:Uncharacterized protein n=1 Tax=Puccinia triticina TaxID=208348 RepID=A0ABY7CUD1_9BASI|nr:uncharacterized protein PtA15_7A48 [Puccinia triticina]WAQ86322.1 hypothetical protein PtA15_7A48 [Puccinia triticina]WAR56199.1 hypothetical protein PtB15_7B44 [Puccinia triticina]